MKKTLPDQYYFIHYFESGLAEVDVADAVRLNEIGYLYIGSGEWHAELESYQENIFTTLEDARQALQKIKCALKNKI